MMIAFEVSSKDQLLCTAGVPDEHCPLSFTVTNVWSRREDRKLKGFTVLVHGTRLADERPENVSWRPDHRMQVGDELRVRIVEVPSVDEPTNVAPARLMEDVRPQCSFCGGTKEDARGMTYSSKAAICRKCLDRFSEMVRGRDK